MGGGLSQNSILRDVLYSIVMLYVYCYLCYTAVLTPKTKLHLKGGAQPVLRRDEEVPERERPPPRGDGLGEVYDSILVGYIVYDIICVRLYHMIA